MVLLCQNQKSFLDVCLLRIFWHSQDCI
jgi:hypothetical protein